MPALFFRSKIFHFGMLIMMGNPPLTIMTRQGISLEDGKNPFLNSFKAIPKSAEWV